MYVCMYVCMHAVRLTCDGVQVLNHLLGCPEPLVLHAGRAPHGVQVHAGRAPLAPLVAPLAPLVAPAGPVQPWLSLTMSMEPRTGAEPGLEGAEGCEAGLGMGPEQAGCQAVKWGCVLHEAVHIVPDEDCLGHLIVVLQALHSAARAEPSSGRPWRSVQEVTVSPIPIVVRGGPPVPRYGTPLVELEGFQPRAKPKLGFGPGPALPEVQPIEALGTQPVEASLGELLARVLAHYALEMDRRLAPLGPHALLGTPLHALLRVPPEDGEQGEQGASERGAQAWGQPGSPRPVHAPGSTMHAPGSTDPGSTIYAPPRARRVMSPGGCIEVYDAAKAYGQQVLQVELGMTSHAYIVHAAAQDPVKGDALLLLTQRSLVYAVQTPWADTSWIASWEINLWEIQQLERTKAGLRVHVIAPPGRVESVVASDSEFARFDHFLQSHIPTLYVRENDATSVMETSFEPVSDGSSLRNRLSCFKC